MSKLQERLRTASRMVPPAFVTEMHEAADALDAMEKALRGMLSISECWETLDGRKNIQLENSACVQSAREALAKLES